MLQFDLYLDAIKATPYGKYLHVGGDEVHLLKRDGKSELELNLIWLNKVCEFAKKHNRIPIFWDDMPLKHAGVYRPMFNSEISEEKVDEIWKKNELNLMQFIEKFPKNAVYMRWNYQKSETYGNQKAMDWYTKNNLKVMGATAGQTRWTLMPQNQSNIPQIKSFAISSIEKNLEGLLLTLWDDDSPHFELYKRGIAAFAQYTWSGNKTTIEEFKTIYRHRGFGPEFSNNEFAFIDKLEKPVSLWLNMLLEEKVRRADLINISKFMLSNFCKSFKLNIFDKFIFIDVIFCNSVVQYFSSEKEIIELAKSVKKVSIKGTKFLISDIIYLF